MMKFLILLGLALYVSSEAFDEALLAPILCVQQKCLPYFDGCDKDEKCTNAFKKCHKECDKDIACYQKCLPDKDSQLALDAANCFVDNKCDKATLSDFQESMTSQGSEPKPSLFQSCLQQHCKQQIDDCFIDNKCRQAASSCQSQCGDNTQCLNNCMKDKQEVAVLSKCMIEIKACYTIPTEPEDKISTKTFKLCVKSHCQQKLMSCQQEDLCQKSFYLCEDECGEDIQCFQTCIPNQGIQMATEIMNCARKSNCVPPPLTTNSVTVVDIQEDSPLAKCMQQSCSAEIERCREDQSCTESVQKCQDNSSGIFDRGCLDEMSRKLDSVKTLFACATQASCL